MSDVDIKTELKSIRDDLNYIKEHMVGVDSVMTEYDYEALLNYREEKRKRKLTSEEDLKVELNI